MEYINIISKEQIFAPPDWHIQAIMFIYFAIMSSTIIYGIKVRDQVKIMYYLVRAGLYAIVFEIIALVICCIFFKEPTGIYKYEATIDKDKITVNQYEEFIEKYNPSIKDGVYHWQE